MVLDSTLGLKYFIPLLVGFCSALRVSGIRKKPEVISVPVKELLMKRNNIWLFILSPLLVLTGVPAHAGIINLTDLLSAGTWTLKNQNSGIGSGVANGTGGLLNGLTVIGSD